MEILELIKERIPELRFKVNGDGIEKISFGDYEVTEATSDGRIYRIMIQEIVDE